MRQQATVGLASAAIESIQINSTALEIRNRRTKLVKHRRVGSELVACIANLFFWLSRSPIHVWVRPDGGVGRISASTFFTITASKYLPKDVGPCTKKSFLERTYLSF
jgi:hypothetical protein